MKYKLIMDIFADGFQKKVNKKLKKGWHIYGGPFYANGYYCQSMILVMTNE